jgi:hypothetical protein
MFDTIGESSVRTVVRPDSTSAVADRQIQVERTERLREARPVEKSEDPAELKQEAQQKESSTRYDLDEHVIVFEKYNKNGEVILRIPPKRTPIDELA